MARNIVEKRPQAIHDLSDLAFRFLEAAEASFEDLAAMPAMGVAREYRDPILEGVRMWRIAGFDNDLIFYRPAESRIEIIRVLHAKRDIEELFGGRS